MSLALETCQQYDTILSLGAKSFSAERVSVTVWAVFLHRNHGVVGPNESWEKTLLYIHNLVMSLWMTSIHLGRITSLCKNTLIRIPEYTQRTDGFRSEEVCRAAVCTFALGSPLSLGCSVTTLPRAKHAPLIGHKRSSSWFSHPFSMVLQRPPIPAGARLKLSTNLVLILSWAFLSVPARRHCKSWWK